jgi:hypothetical protein
MVAMISKVQNVPLMMELKLMNIDPTVLAFRSTAEGAEKVLAELEAELADAKSRRGKILADINKANEAAVRDQRARLELPRLNKEEAAVSRLIRSIEMQIGFARKRVAMADQAAAAKASKAPEQGEPGRLIQLEIRAPDGRVLRQFHKSVDAARAALQPGYEVTGEVIGANIVSPIGPGARSFMKALLDAQGDELEAWLASRGIVGCVPQSPELAGKKQTVVLPSNGRDLQ